MMRRLLLPFILLASAPAAVAADASCGAYQRCIDYFQHAMCLRYDGLPASYTPEERAIAAFVARLEAQGCPTAARDGFHEACEAVRGLTFGEGEAQDCQALAAQTR